MASTTPQDGADNSSSTPTAGSPSGSPPSSPEHGTAAAGTGLMNGKAPRSGPAHPPSPPLPRQEGAGTQAQAQQQQQQQQAAAGAAAAGGVRKPSLLARVKEVAEGVWLVSKIFSPPVQNPLLRVLALWLVATRILVTFVVTLVASAVAQAVPSLKAPLIATVLAVFVPRDEFFRPCVDIIHDSARV